MTLKELLTGLDYELIAGDIQANFENIAYDSRKCNNGTLFCAIKGTQSDGHEYIKTSIHHGAKIIILEDLPAVFSENITYIQVKNTRIALACISHTLYDNPTSKMKVIGVTGTNGKTTITYLLKSIFESNGEKCGIIGTTGIIIGNEKIPTTHTTPESLELCGYFNMMLKKNVTTVIMEVSSHSLSQHRVDYIDFDTALFTNLTPDHLDYHSNMFEYANAKKKLFDLLKPDSNSIIFDNSEYSKYLVADCRSDSIRFIGRNLNCDIQIFGEKLELGKSSFKLLFNKSIKVNIQTILSGRFNIDNAAMAASTALTDNISPEIVIQGLSKTNGAPGRMQQVQLKNGALAIVDYAHTPDALEKALIACREVLDSTKNSGRLICVFGCGGDRDKTKRPVMGEIAASLADWLIVTSDNPRKEEPEIIINEILSGIPGEIEKYTFSTNRSEAIKAACDFSESNDLIFVGGKGHEDYQIIGTQKYHFDDIEELEKWNSNSF